MSRYLKSCEANARFSASSIMSDFNHTRLLFRRRVLIVEDGPKFHIQNTRLHKAVRNIFKDEALCWTR